MTLQALLLAYFNEQPFGTLAEWPTNQGPSGTEPSESPLEKTREATLLQLWETQDMLEEFRQELKDRLASPLPRPKAHQLGTLLPLVMCMLDQLRQELNQFGIHS